MVLCCSWVDEGNWSEEGEGEQEEEGEGQQHFENRWVDRREFEAKNDDS